MVDQKTLILDSNSANQKIKRIAYQIVEKYHLEKDLIFVGISSKGFVLSEKILTNFSLVSSINVNLIELKVNKKDPLSEPISIQPEVELKNKTVVLIDDVLNSGKTLMHAASVITQKGAKQINTVVLIDRRHRKFPIRADWVGLTLSTTLQEHITVEFNKDKIEAYLH
ncbi:MAG: phosphoribosyltransferase [Crocinitomicaceae bacterium]|nr:phosphoribosyltransferase [Crocinitomicaceae bacterium]|tara:strand:- start:114 stop:617 length:504 start_codon:yes stop_codon:yes gene_type:complete